MFHNDFLSYSGAWFCRLCWVWPIIIICSLKLNWKVPLRKLYLNYAPIIAPWVPGSDIVYRLIISEVMNGPTKVRVIIFPCKDKLN